MRGRRAESALLALVVVFVGACSGGGRSSAPQESTTPASQVFTAVVLGDAASVVASGGGAIRDTWPQQFYLHALPRGATFVNLATESLTVDAMVARAVPALAELHPKVVAVLAGMTDAGARTATGSFAASVRELLSAVRATGARRVLVATLPSGAGAVGPYNDIIRLEAARSRAVLVELSNVSVSGVRDPTTGGFVPDAAGHRAIAAAFERAYAAAFPTG